MQWRLKKGSTSLKKPSKIKPRISREKWPPLALTSDMIVYSNYIFTHDWGSIGIMKRSFRILHLSDCVTTSTIAAIIVLVPQPIFHCAGCAVLLQQNSEWTHGFGFFLLQMWLLCLVGEIRSVLIDQPRSLSRFIENLRGLRRLPWQAIQGVSPPSERRMGISGFVATLQVCKRL